MVSYNGIKIYLVYYVILYKYVGFDIDFCYKFFVWLFYDFNLKYVFKKEN